MMSYAHVSNLCSSSSTYIYLVGKEHAMCMCVCVCVRERKTCHVFVVLLTGCELEIQTVCRVRCT